MPLFFRIMINCFFRFILELTHLKVYCNEDKTRTFISICVAETFCDSLKKLVKTIDKVFTEFNLPIFYENPSFHVSILWCLGNQKSIITAIINKLKVLLNNFLLNDNDDFQIVVSNVKCKIGNQIHNLSLT